MGVEPVTPTEIRPVAPVDTVSIPKRVFERQVPEGVGDRLSESFATMELFANDDECCSDPGAISECWWLDAENDKVTCGEESEFCGLGFEGNPGSGNCDDTDPAEHIGPAGERLCKCDNDSECVTGICIDGLCRPDFCDGYLVCSCFGGCTEANLGGYATPDDMCETEGGEDGWTCCQGTYPGDSQGTGIGFCSDRCPGENAGECTADADCAGNPILDPYSSDCAEFQCDVTGACVLLPINVNNDCVENVQGAALLYGATTRTDAGPGNEETSCYEARCDNVGRCMPDTGAPIEGSDCDPTDHPGCSHICEDGQCVYAAGTEGRPCNQDDDACTKDECDDAGACVVGPTEECIESDDPNSMDSSGVNFCSTDSCVENGPDHIDDWECTDSALADGEDASTNGFVDTDLCFDLLCFDGQESVTPIDCSAPDSQCPDGTCDSVLGCVYTAGDACDADSNDCTEDQCDNTGTCVWFQDKDCSGEDDQCNTGVCNDTTGLCEKDGGPKHGDPCDDTVNCTENDACNNGVCEGIDIDCPDPYTCNTYSCDETDGVCKYDNSALHGTPCDGDGNVCTIEACSGDPAGSTELTCSFDSNAADTTGCDDGLDCTSSDHCDGNGSCVSTDECPTTVPNDACNTYACQATATFPNGTCVLTSAMPEPCCVDDSDCATELCSPAVDCNQTVCDEDGSIGGTPNRCVCESLASGTGCTDFNTVTYSPAECFDGECDGLGTCLGVDNGDCNCPDFETWYGAAVEGTITINGVDMPSTYTDPTDGDIWRQLASGDTTGTNYYDPGTGYGGGDDAWEIDFTGASGKEVFISGCRYGGAGYGAHDDGRLILFRCVHTPPAAWTVVVNNDDGCGVSGGMAHFFYTMTAGEGPYYLIVDTDPSWPSDNGPYDIAIYYEPNCSDGLKNNDELEVDCGGSEAGCPACPGTCNDYIQNQGEDDVDCGGPNCPPCSSCECASNTDCPDGEFCDTSDAPDDDPDCGVCTTRFDMCYALDPNSQIAVSHGSTIDVAMNGGCINMEITAGDFWDVYNKGQNRAIKLQASGVVSGTCTFPYTLHYTSKYCKSIGGVEIFDAETPDYLYADMANCDSFGTIHGTHSLTAIELADPGQTNNRIPVRRYNLDTDIYFEGDDNCVIRFNVWYDGQWNDGVDSANMTCPTRNEDGLQYLGEWDDPVCDPDPPVHN